MPVNDGYQPLDLDKAFLDYYIDQVRADDTLYRQRVEERREADRHAAAALAAKEARREWMRTIARKKRGRKPGSRPWQALGLTKAEWVDQGQPDARPMTPFRLPRP